MPIIKKKWQTKFVTEDFAGSFDWLVKTNSNRNIVGYKEVYRVTRALVKTSVIARQKYDYIYYNSIPLSNISYGLICVCSASDTQLIALRQGYDLSRLRLHARQKRKKNMKRLKKRYTYRRSALPMLSTIEQRYLLRPNRQRLPLVQETCETLKEQFFHID